MDSGLPSTGSPVEDLTAPFKTLQVSEELIRPKQSHSLGIDDNTWTSVSPCSTSWNTPQSYLPASTGVGNYQNNYITSPKVLETKTDCSSITDNTQRLKVNIKVASLVFFDLETTGLGFEIGPSNVQIAEVSMVAISRKDFAQSSFEDFRDIRIIQKLCFCTRPRSSVSPTAAMVNGLTNESLMEQNPFDLNAAESINFFLSHLPKPVCLLAHNGNTYDFPLLKAEFSRLGMSLSTDILIADTLKAFKALELPRLSPEKTCKSVKFTKKGKVSCSLSNLYLYFFSENPTRSHSSEGDCIALAKICHQMKDSILLWVDENYKTFESISRMW